MRKEDHERGLLSPSLTPAETPARASVQDGDLRTDDGKPNKEDAKMAKLYGEALKQSIIEARERTLRSQQERWDRIDKGWTDEDDCFMSIKGDQQALSNYAKQLDILNGDGMMDYEAVMDEQGNEVGIRWVNTRYGVKVVGRGVFANSLKALLKKTGWHTEMTRVPCWTKFCSSASGLLGVYSGWYEVVRWHTNMVTGEYVGYPD